MANYLLQKLLVMGNGVFLPMIAFQINSKNVLSIMKTNIFTNILDSIQWQCTKHLTKTEAPEK
jgi:hypothetical protein